MRPHPPLHPPPPPSLSARALAPPPRGEPRPPVSWRRRVRGQTPLHPPPPAPPPAAACTRSARALHALCTRCTRSARALRSAPPPHALCSALPPHALCSAPPPHALCSARRRITPRPRPRPPHRPRPRPLWRCMVFLRLGLGEALGDERESAPERGAPPAAWLADIRTARRFALPTLSPNRP